MALRDSYIFEKTVEVVVAALSSQTSDAEAVLNPELVTALIGAVHTKLSEIGKSIES